MRQVYVLVACVRSASVRGLTGHVRVEAAQRVHSVEDAANDDCTEATAVGGWRPTWLKKNRVETNSTINLECVCVCVFVYVCVCACLFRSNVSDEILCTEA